jgi:hypothetical protein
MSEGLKTTFIYALVDPITDLPRYIGKSDNPIDRYKEHLYDKNKSYKCSWINYLKEKSLLPILRIIEECDFKFWKEREIYWVSFCIECGIKLTNLTKGGDGGACEESKKKISEASKKMWQDPKYRQKQKTSRLKQFTEERRKKISEISKQKWQDPEFRMKQKETRKNNPYKHTQEAKKKQSEIAKKISIEMWKDPEFRMKQKIGIEKRNYKRS